MIMKSNSYKTVPYVTLPNMSLKGETNCVLYNKVNTNNFLDYVDQECGFYVLRIPLLTANAVTTQMP